MIFKKEMVCLDCGNRGTGVTKVRGNAGLEILLWLFFIIPGLLYSLWRATQAYQACRLCGSANLVPVNSPKGQEIISSKKA